MHTYTRAQWECVCLCVYVFVLTKVSIHLFCFRWPRCLCSHAPTPIFITLSLDIPDLILYEEKGQIILDNDCYKFYISFTLAWWVIRTFLNTSVFKENASSLPQTKMTLIAILTIKIHWQPVLNCGCRKNFKTPSYRQGNTCYCG